MSDREKVIKGLEVCLAADLSEDENPCAPCPYFFDGMCQNTMKKDALALLREQKVGKWIKLQGMAPPEYHGHKICSVCESFAPYDPLHPWREELSPYCPSCGAKMEVSEDD